MMAVMDSVRRTSGIELHSILSIKLTQKVFLALVIPSPCGKGRGTYHH